MVMVRRLVKPSSWFWLALAVALTLLLMALTAPQALAQGEPQIEYVSHAIIYDSINHDGVANPGEMIHVTVTVSNTGTYTAFELQGSLSALTWYATCYGVANYGDLGPGQQGTSGDGELYFRLSPLTPDGHVVELVLELIDSYGGYYPISFDIPVVDNVGPALTDSSVSPQVVAPTEPVTLTATLLDGAGVAVVTGTIRSSDNAFHTEFPMYDDGAHGDGDPGDSVFGAVWTTPVVAHDFLAGFQAQDALGYVTEYPDQEGFSTRSFSRQSNILLVIDELNEPGFDDYYASALAANGLAYDVWYTFYRGPVPSDTIMSYLPAIVIWAVPEEGTLTDLYDSSARDTLVSYLDHGGKLFITGQDIGYYIHDQTLYTDYFHAAFVEDSVGLYAIRGIAGDEIGDGLEFTIEGTGTGAGNQEWPSEIDPIAPAERVFEYYIPGGAMALDPRSAREKPIGKDGRLPESRTPGRIRPNGIVSSGTAAVRVDTSTYKVVYFAFGFEGIDETADRNAVMQAVIGWLHGHSLFEKALVPGWNLVSLPVIPESTAITDVLSSIAGQYTLVQAYDAGSDTWKSYDPALPPEASDLLTLDERTPFWIEMSEAGTLTLDGLLPIYTEQNLVTGWNLIGYPASDPRTVPDALTSIEGKYTKVLRYEAGQSDPWKRYSTDMPPWANTLTQMAPGWGYWIYVTEDCTLSILN